MNAIQFRHLLTGEKALAPPLLVDAFGKALAGYPYGPPEVDRMRRLAAFAVWPGPA